MWPVTLTINTKRSVSNLTPKQKIFVEEYLQDMNGAQAAKRAGFSPKTAKVIASKLLSRPEIKQAIQQALNERRDFLIANRNERMIFLTQTMRDSEESTKYRLKACELLSKIDGDNFLKNEGATLADILVQLN